MPLFLFDFSCQSFNLKEELKQELIKEAINKLDNPWKDLTVKDVSKDLKMGENLTNELFKRADVPSINKRLFEF